MRWNKGPFPFDTVEIVWNRHENSSALFSSGRSFVFKICIPPIPDEIVCSLQFDQLIDQSLITSLRDVSAEVEFSRLACTFVQNAISLQNSSAV